MILASLLANLRNSWNKREYPWQPIETLPDGKEALLWEPTPRAWPKRPGIVRVGRRRDDGNFSAAGWTPYAPSDVFTHWMEFPEPPEVEK